MSQLPSYLHRFFWEYDPNCLDIHKHSNIIMARIMERGSWQAMVWLKKAYSSEVIAYFLSEKGWRVLAPREINYWALLSGMNQDIKKQLLEKIEKRDGVWSRRSAC